MAVFSVSYGQDINYARQQVQKLSSPAFMGRGYVRNGDIIASEYLAGSFKNFHLKSFKDGFYQNYEFEVNTFPGNMKVIVDGLKLVPGIDFLVDPASSGCNGSFEILRIDSSQLAYNYNLILQSDVKQKFIFLDTLGFGKDKSGIKVIESIKNNKLKCSGIAVLTDKPLIYSARTYQLGKCVLDIKRSSVPVKTHNIKVKIQNKLILHKARNVVGYISGKSDSAVVFTAHYDHLGHMGKDVYFPGANDNASGTAMVLDLIRFYTSQSDNRKYTYIFILFSGEEAGLLGSEYFVSHPLFPLQKIKILINLDMVGAGSGGVTVFNGNNYPMVFHKLDSVNKSLGLSLLLNSKGNSRNSDHYPFSLNKVPALFLLTEGKEIPYHSIKDNYATLPFTAYEKLFKLITEYVKGL